MTSFSPFFLRPPLSMLRVLTFKTSGIVGSRFENVTCREHLIQTNANAKAWCCWIMMSRQIKMMMMMVMMMRPIVLPTSIPACATSQSNTVDQRQWWEIILRRNRRDFYSLQLPPVYEQLSPCSLIDQIYSLNARSMLSSYKQTTFDRCSDILSLVTIPPGTMTFDHTAQ